LIEGHTDSVGTDAYNQDLSERRAMAVKTALIRANVDPARINTYGYGETRPIAGNNTDAGRLKNRRVEIVIRN
jgi:outer membrane protein OmpA-like peptidoglycan-associated protein